MNSPSPQRCHRGSCLCETHELRITRRCLADDLNVDPGTEFANARSHPIVEAFETQRSTNPTGGKTVGPIAGERTIYRLGSGHDHRGATWFDGHEQVVWLCAYGFHRSGEVDDAFPYFHDLIREGRMLPTEDDYEALFWDRAHRFAETLPQDAQNLLAKARSNPGVEQVGILGERQNTSIVVEVVEILEETYVAFSLAQIGDYTMIVSILAAFFPNAVFSEWEQASMLPTRALRDYEVCYRMLRG